MKTREQMKKKIPPLCIIIQSFIINIHDLCCIDVRQCKRWKPENIIRGTLRNRLKSSNNISVFTYVLKDNSYENSVFFILILKRY